MAKNRCVVCNNVYDDEKKDISFENEDWNCHVCSSPKTEFVPLTEKKESSPKEDSTVSDILIQQMAEWGVKYVFGIPGTSSLGLVEAIRKNNAIKYIQVRHEQSAAFMASAYGKLTGNVAACLTIAG
ncbi:MAG: thiamine pyrophosphate-binding protein, partial [Methanobacterium sp.]